MDTAPKKRLLLPVIISSLVTSLLLPTDAKAINVADIATGGVTTASMTAILQGAGVTINNLSITNIAGCNSSAGIGIFTQGTSAAGLGPVLGEPTGIVIGSGAIVNGNAVNSSNNAAGVTNTLCTGTASDPDMIALEAGTVNGEYSAIEFDVVPQTSTLAIPFQFGSDEFPEYVCSSFGDVVGIFVSGTGINGPFSGALNAQNYAKTAGGDLSSINWVNTGVIGQNGNLASCGSLANAAFYTDNSNGNTTGGNNTVATTNANIEMDGFTNTLFQPIPVVPGQSYHVKIAVADSADRAFDSTAFIHPIFSTATFTGFDFGDAPNSYRTLTSNGGALHGINASIFLGAVPPDSEITGAPSTNADADDLTGTNDEDGITTFPALVTSATDYSLDVSVTNNTGRSGRLIGWIDFNKNGAFDASEGASALVASGTNNGTANLSWSGLSGLTSGDTYLRLRFSTDIKLSTLTPGSTMIDGEVEDFLLTIQEVNFDKYVSTNATCNDTLDAITVAPATNVFYCYTVSNPNTQPFVINAGNTSDSQGHDISALEQTYAPGASQTVIIGPISADSAQLPLGATTINNAQIIATINGTDVVDNESASVLVANNPPASGVKQLYFDTVNGTPNLTRQPPGSNTQTGNTDLVTLNQGLVFQSPFTITGGTTSNVQLRIRRRGGGNRTIQTDLLNGNTGTLIGSTTMQLTGGGWKTLQVPIAIASDVNFATGDFIQVVVRNVPASNGNIQLRTLQGAVRSELQIDTNTVINVDSIEVFSAAFPATTKFLSYTPGSTVFVRALVSDPFGSADITSANISITDSGGTPRVSNQAMSAVDDPTGATRLYEFQYTIPAAPEGSWAMSVTANEGSEGSITHSLLDNMVVGVTQINISKNSQTISDPINGIKPKAIPNAIVEYTINIENSGFGYVDSDTIVLTDPLSPGTTLFFGNPLDPVTFSQGTTSSGLTPVSFVDLADTNDDIDFSNDGGSTFVTPVVDGSGFDITSPKINFIRFKLKGNFNGSDGVNNPSMNLKFRVRVD